MTTMSASTPTATCATDPGNWRRAVHYTLRSAVITAKNWSFVLFSVALPGGGSTHSVAAAVHLPEGTVRTLGAASRAEAVRIATNNDWLG